MILYKYMKIWSNVGLNSLQDEISCSDTVSVGGGYTGGE